MFASTWVKIHHEVTTVIARIRRGSGLVRNGAKSRKEVQWLRPQVRCRTSASKYENEPHLTRSSCSTDPIQWLGRTCKPPHSRHARGSGNDPVAAANARSTIRTADMPMVPKRDRALATPPARTLSQADISPHRRGNPQSRERSQSRILRRTFHRA